MDKSNVINVRRVKNPLGSLGVTLGLVYVHPEGVVLDAFLKQFEILLGNCWRTLRSRLRPVDSTARIRI